MNILLCSHLYAPSVGGIETMSATLARAWTSLGHTVRVVTTTPGANEVGGVPILRNPSARDLWRESRWCDLCFHNNISLRWAWAPLVTGRPWVVAHQTWLKKADGSVGWQERLKRFLLRFGHSVAISSAIARHLPYSSITIPNAYEDGLFSAPVSESSRDREVVFVGRFVSDKGGDLLISALSLLAQRGVRLNLTMIGEGRERKRWVQLAEKSGVADQVRWIGALQGESLVNELRQHEIMVVPSRWAEPFGIVALEGAACGCVVVGSEAGGLIDAIGPCGVTFTNGDVDGLASALTHVKGGGGRCSEKQAKAHLKAHQSDAVAGRYLRLFEEVVR